MSLRDDIIKKLIEAKIESPRMECDIILRHATPNYPQVREKEKQLAEEMLEKRITQHMPMDKIIGKREFYKSIFTVNNNVLSPRPDTEVLVESAVEILKKIPHAKILDLGTGSGCILLSLLKEYPLSQGVGVDISAEAISVAQENAKNLQVEKQVQFIHQSWENLSLTEETYDIIVSNPPYIVSKEINNLQEEVKKYDPLIALDGGQDGLDCYRKIAKIAPKLMKKNACILLEVGYNQAEDVANIFMQQGFNMVKIIPDLSGINRCVILKK